MVSTAFRNLIDLECLPKGTQYLTFENIIQFIGANFCEGERDIFIAMLVNLKLKVKMVFCGGRVVEGYCTKCGKKYKDSQIFCVQEIAIYPKINKKKIVNEGPPANFIFTNKGVNREEFAKIVEENKIRRKEGKPLIVTKQE